jgi:hypothetical protein
MTPTLRDYLPDTDYLDSRDLIEAQSTVESELDALRDELTEARADGDDGTVSVLNQEVEALSGILDQLRIINDDGTTFPDWDTGTTLIPDTDFENYARDLAESIYGDEVRDYNWPFSCIDWSQAAYDLKLDYSQIYIDNQLYWVRG